MVENAPRVNRLTPPEATFLMNYSDANVDNFTLHAYSRKLPDKEGEGWREKDLENR